MPYNPGNVRRLNALGGKRPQATGIAILPKNGDRVLNTSEGSVNNYGGNKKMGLYSNVGMSYQFQNLNLTGSRINGQMPYFWGTKHAITKKSKKQKNMITVKMLDDGNNGAGRGTKGFVSAPYWGHISRALVDDSQLDNSYQNTSMGSVNGKGSLIVGDCGVIAIEMWRGTNGGGSFGPVNAATHPGIHIWTQKPLNFSSVVIRQGGVQCRLGVTAIYSKAQPPGTDTTGEIGNLNNQVAAAFTAGTFPAANAVVTSPGPLNNVDTARVYWLKFPAASTTDGANARLIFPSTSGTNATLAGQNIYRDMAIYFE